MLLRYSHFCIVLVVLGGLTVNGCTKHEDAGPRIDSASSSRTDSSSNVHSGTSAQAESNDQVIPAPGPGGIVMLSQDDPESKPPIPLTPQTSQTPQTGTTTGRMPIGTMPIMSSTELAKLHPTIPGYRRDEHRLFSRDVPGVVSKSTAIYRNVNDSNQTIRLTIVDQDERYADRMIKEIMALEANDGKKVSVSPSGEVLTAYEVHVNGTIGASCYIPSEHIATLSLVVGDHRLVQFREQPATSRDHLVEVAKYFDVKKYENAR
jgi:hypothetical protein